MKNRISTDILTAIVIVLNIIMIAVFYRKLPQVIPLQWSIDGDVTRSEDKIFLFFIPLISVVIYAVNRLKSSAKSAAPLIASLLIIVCEALVVFLSLK